MTATQLHWATKANALQLADLNDMARAVSTLFVTGPIAADRLTPANSCESSADVCAGPTWGVASFR